MPGLRATRGPQALLRDLWQPARDPHPRSRWQARYLLRLRPRASGGMRRVRPRREDRAQGQQWAAGGRALLLRAADRVLL